jgi:NADP-dependent 3-hydroxy acid dehydrogenase YdfG
MIASTTCSFDVDEVNILLHQGMKARGAGHLINMGSVAGHYAYATGSGSDQMYIMTAM